MTEDCWQKLHKIHHPVWTVKILYVFWPQTQQAPLKEFSHTGLVNLGSRPWSQPLPWFAQPFLGCSHTYIVEESEGYTPHASPYYWRWKRSSRRRRPMAYSCFDVAPVFEHNSMTKWRFAGIWVELVRYMIECRKALPVWNRQYFLVSVSLWAYLVMW